MAVGSCLSVILALTACTSTVRGTRTNAALKAQRSSNADASDNSDVQFLDSPDAEPLPAQDGAGADLADQFTADLAVKEAANRHSVMQQFMKNFARNMRRAVLQDSGGDMPEEERQTMLAQVSDGDSSPEAEDNPDAAWMKQQRRAHHRHMLNGGRMVPSHAAEDIEQPSVDEDHMEHPVHRRHHHPMMLNHMLNARHRSELASDENDENSEERPQEQPEQQAEEAPPEESSAPLRAPDGRLVVADALGRKMPMLFSRPGEEQQQQPKPLRSATQGVAFSVGVLALLIATH